MPDNEDPEKFNHGIRLAESYQAPILPTHRSGWDQVIQTLAKLHRPKGIVLDPFIERSFVWGDCAPLQYQEPWIGFIHIPPLIPDWFDGTTQSNEVILKRADLQRNFSLCKGLFTLSDYHKTHLEQLTSIPVNTLYYPTIFPKQKWSWEAFSRNPDKKIVQIGWWLRKLNAIYELPATSYRKVFLRVMNNDYFRTLVGTERKLHRKAGIFNDAMIETVDIIDYLSNADYDRLMSQNLMFADLYDTSANTAVVECIARCTPILINRLKALVEYLGPDYPLFYDSYEQAACMARDLPLIKQTHEYLCDLPIRHRLTFDAFLESFVQSDIYQANCAAPGTAHGSKKDAALEFVKKRTGDQSFTCPQDLETIPFEQLYAHIDQHTQTLSGAMPPETMDGSVVLLCLLKNAGPYLPEFLAHYKGLGIKEFVFLDNGSTDDTIELLKRTPGVVLLQNLLPFKVYCLALRQYLAQRFAKDRWCLVADADEFFDYPLSRFLDLSGLTAYLDKKGFNAVVTQMLDLYSRDDVGKSGRDLQFRQSHRYYDIADIEKQPYPFDNHTGDADIPFLTGGMRKRAFGLDEVWLTKHALFRNESGVELCHEHYVTGANIADITAVLYHYKFLDHFPAYVDDAVAGQYHYEGSLEYKSYQKKLNQARGLNLFHDESKELICVDQLIKDQFLHVSAPYLTYVQSRIQDNDALFQGWSKQMADLKKETIQVITAADNNYAVPVTIMLFSLLENLKKAQPIEITILTCDMASFARKRLFDLVKGFENATIRFLSVPGNHFDHLGTRSAYISAATYFRFAVPDLLPGFISKALYMDADMIVLKDISLLWQIDLRDNAVAAVPDKTKQIWTDKWNDWCYQRLQMSPDKPYFNAGLLLMNLDVWRKQNISAACLKFMDENPERVIFDDQDALNWVLKACWLILDLKWNVTTVCFEDQVQRRIAKAPLAAQVKDPCIIHYSNKEKPWQLEVYHKKKQLFLDYWARYSLPRSFHLRPDNKEIRPGNSVICICHRAIFLKKALASWLAIEEIDEIVLVEPGRDPGVSQVLTPFENMARVVIIRLDKKDACDLNDGVLYNLALGMTSRDKILKLAWDTLLYDNFFKQTRLTPDTFYRVMSWMDWFSRDICVDSTFYASRQDLIRMNGFHEKLTGDMACFDMLHRLFELKRRVLWIDNTLFLIMDPNARLLSDFNPLGTLTLPPLDRDEIHEIIELKATQMTRTAPWDHKNVPTPFSLLTTGVQNGWIAKVSSDIGNAQSIDHEQIDQKTFKVWLLKKFPHMAEFTPWFEGCDMGQMSRRLFSPENMPATLAGLLYGNPNNSKTYLEKLVDRSGLFEKWWALKERYWYRKWQIKTGCSNIFKTVIALPGLLFEKTGIGKKP